MATAAGEDRKIRVLVPKLSLLPPSSSSPALLWLVGSPLFLPHLTVAAAFRCLNFEAGDGHLFPDIAKEAGEIRTSLIRGFDIVGALLPSSPNKEEDTSRKAIELSWKLREHLFGEKGSHDMVGAIADSASGDTRFYVAAISSPRAVKLCDAIYVESPDICLWEKGCLLRCELALRFPLYISSSGAADMFSSLVDSTAAKLRDPQTVYLVEGFDANFEEAPRPILLHGEELNFTSSKSDQQPVMDSDKEWENNVDCSYFCLKNQSNLSSGRESAAVIQVTVLSNQSMSYPQSSAPVLKYMPAPSPLDILTVSLKLDVLCYASVEFPLGAAIALLVVPGLVDQLVTMKKAVLSELHMHHSQLHPYHFLPAGMLIPVTAIYDLRYGEIEDKQGELRKSMHLRLGLPLDRPLMRISNALNFGRKERRERSLTREGAPLLRDVHAEIAPSGVLGGRVSLIDGSYEYFHYLQDGFDDNGWGCAYRSLQTIVSWYKLQQYTSVTVPSHREIQQALVEIGDKDKSFIGSTEWIGAIELSFVLDKLLGVSCKVINVRSGEELPEKCREIAMHFETQGTPIMIGGGVLAYTLLGVDFNEATGDCAFLILDPHYTGADDLRKIVSGGWCGWKKSVDSKGKSFFLKDRFYNLLLPQRPSMV